MEPPSAHSSSGARLTVTGTGFGERALVLLGYGCPDGPARPLRDTAPDGPGRLAGTLPPGRPGTVDVVVRTPVGVACLEDGFTYLPDPSALVVDAVTPPSGHEGGGTAVVVHGRGFSPGVRVAFGGRDASRVVLVDATAIEATTPSGRGRVDVEVVDGPLRGALPAGFTYRSPPTLREVVPQRGPLGGGTRLSVRGQGLDQDGVRITVGGRDVQLLEAREGGVWDVLTAPGERPGPATVAVTAPTGVALLPAAFDYVAPPHVDFVLPRSGIAGDHVVVVGSGFDPATEALLGDRPLEGLVVAEGRLEGLAPDADAAGPVTLTVRHPFGEAQIEQAFWYGEPALDRLDALFPEEGPEAGGNRFWIRGAALPRALSVWFGANTVNDVEVVDGAAIRGTVPQGRGTVDVTVSADGWELTLPEAYTYGPGGPLAVTDVHPSVAPPIRDFEGAVVFGAGFDDETRVLVGGKPLRNQRLVHSGQIRGDIPRVWGDGSVIVIDREGQRSAGSRLAISYPPVFMEREFVGSCWPRRAPTSGGTRIECGGDGLQDVITARFGDGDPVDVESAELGKVVVTVPAGAPGVVDVVFCTEAGCPELLTVEHGFTYLADDATPVVDLMRPDVGPVDGGTEVQVFGGPFAPGTTATLGGWPIEDLERVGPAELRGTTPRGSGDADLVVTSGDFTGTAVRAFRYQSQRPRITGFAPRSGPADWPVEITITGQSIPRGTRAFVGTVELVDTTFRGNAGEMRLIGTLPPGMPGEMRVRVETRSGGATLREAYVREPWGQGDPQVLWVDPDAGPARGGTPVVLRGRKFPRTRFMIGPASVVFFSGPDEGTAIVWTPGGVVGRPLPLVTVVSDELSTELPDAFTYRSVPRASTVIPATVPDGGLVPARVDVVDHTDDTHIEIGGYALGDAEYVPQARAMQGTMPPAAAGTYAVRAFDRFGETVVDEAVLYEVGPLAHAVVPRVLPPEGGDVVVEGSALAGGAEIQVGGAPLADPVLIDAETITGTAPPGFGFVDVVATRGSRRSVLRSALQYLPTPKLDALTPAVGSVAGGAEVTATGIGLHPDMETRLGGVPVDTTLPPDDRSGHRLRFVTPPAGAQGAAVLQAVCPRGVASLTDAFRYVPEVVSLTGHDTLSTSFVHAIGSAPDGTVWAGTDTGLYRVDGWTDDVVGFPGRGLPSPSVRSLDVDDSGIVAAGTAAGLALCEPRDGFVCRQVDARDLPDADDPLTVGALALTARWEALAAAERSVWRVPTGRREGGTRLGALAGAQVRQLRAVPGRRAVIATTSSGVYRVDAISGEAERLAEGDPVTAALGPDGRLWLGNGEGLFYLDPSEPGGAPAPVEGFGEDGVLNLSVDPHTGAAWVATRRAVTCVSGSPPIAGRRVTSEDGLPGVAVTTVHATGRWGVFVGTDEGLARYAGGCAAP